MYVPGKLKDTSKVIIDIGTGYYAQKVSFVSHCYFFFNFNIFFQNIEEAKDYFKRKTVFVTEQMEKIQVLGLEKSKIRDAIVDVMEMKLQSQVAAQN